MAVCCQRLSWAVLVRRRGREQRKGSKIGFLGDNGALSLIESSVNEDSLVEMSFSVSRWFHAKLYYDIDKVEFMVKKESYVPVLVPRA